MNERERLIADLIALSAARRKDHSYYDANILDRAIAALSKPQPLQGWVKESTPEMRVAGYDWLAKHSTVQLGLSTIGGLFSAMIEAAQDK